jgi:hypothetical protein
MAFSKWSIGKRTNGILKKNLLAQTNLLFFYIAFNYRRNATEEVCYAGNHKLINHVGPILSGRNYARFLQDEQVLRDRRLIELEQIKDLGKRLVAGLQEFNDHQTNGMSHCLDDLSPYFRILK